MISIIKKIIISTLMMIIVMTTYSFAYSTQKYGWKTIRIPIRTNAPGYSVEISRAINEWNSIHPSVQIYYDSKAPNVIYSGYYNNNWIGYYEYYTSNGKLTRFNIYLNNNKLNGKSSKYKQGIVAHELGHALGLNDNSYKNTASLMSIYRDKNVIIKPTADDIKGVKAIYKLK